MRGVADVGEFLPGLVVTGVGVVLLVVLLAVVARAVRRFSRAGAALRARLERGTAELRANVPRRGGDGAVTVASRDRPHP